LYPFRKERSGWKRKERTAASVLQKSRTDIRREKKSVEIPKKKRSFRNETEKFF